VAAQRGREAASFASPGEALAWVSGLVFCLSAFMGWYSLESPLGTVSVTGWNTGTLGKLVFFLGLVILAFLFLHATGVELPPMVRGGVVVAALGAVGAIFVLIRVIDIPDRFSGTGRSIGLWISLASAFVVVVAGLVRTGEELEAPAPPRA
jgi:hypothetical protein